MVYFLCSNGLQDTVHPKICATKKPRQLHAVKCIIDTTVASAVDSLSYSYASSPMCGPNEISHWYCLVQMSLLVSWLLAECIFSEQAGTIQHSLVVVCLDQVAQPLFHDITTIASLPDIVRSLVNHFPL